MSERSDPLVDPAVLAARARLDGKPDEMRSTLSALCRGTWPLLERHVAVRDLVTAGAARSLGVLPGHLDSGLEILEPFMARMRMAIAEASG